ncbi:hypothetical protein RSAG8_00516, partial [Rhizoctonia solani AG-8 WAC10335]
MRTIPPPLSDTARPTPISTFSARSRYVRPLLYCRAAFEKIKDNTKRGVKEA